MSWLRALECRSRVPGFKSCLLNSLRGSERVNLSGLQSSGERCHRLLEERRGHMGHAERSAAA